MVRCAKKIQFSEFFVIGMAILSVLAKKGFGPLKVKDHPISIFHRKIGAV